MRARKGLAAARAGGYAGVVRKRAVAAVTALLLVSPVVRAAGDARRRAQDELYASYLAQAREQLKGARSWLETSQEMFLTPHSFDGPVEAALLHLDLAEAHLAAAEPTLLRALNPGAPADAWTPFDERVRRAKAVLRRLAPDLADAADSVPIVTEALAGATQASFSKRRRRIAFRGYYALNEASPEFLAAMLAHEATHALGASRPGSERRTAAQKFEEEVDARRRECEVWRALGADPRKDFDGMLGAQAAACGDGEARLREFARAESETNAWEWIPPKAAPASPGATPTAREGPPPTPAEIDAMVDRLRRNFSAAALGYLSNARLALGDIPELVEPRLKIVTYDVMKLWILEPGHYSEELHSAYQALTPVMDELEAASAALSRKTVSKADLAALKKYGRDMKDAATAAGTPGFWQARAGRAEIASAWAAHRAVHARQGAVGRRPTVDEEVEAVRASLRDWKDRGADAGFDSAHPDRYLRFRVADQAGGEVLKDYVRRCILPR